MRMGAQAAINFAFGIDAAVLLKMGLCRIERSGGVLAGRPTDAKRPKLNEPHIQTIESRCVLLCSVSFTPPPRAGCQIGNFFGHWQWKAVILKVSFVNSAFVAEN